MFLAPWRSPIARALHRNRSLAYARYLQLATVRPDGKPANRTLVFRGFLDDTNQLKFVTDDRSEKIHQIESQPWGEACWYFEKTREQFRLSGLLTLIGEHHPDDQLRDARKTQWQELSDAARLQFIWPHPGQPRTHDASFDIDPPESNAPPSNFCVLLLEPINVDQLELRGDPQNRWIYSRDDQLNWSTKEVNP
ncbi:MAG: Npun_F5749 family FMN-dependent PPOX-type flavoprotein [Elainellaceae cyanobacterium]